PIFAVQYHPEASPGPHDSMYLFDEFKKMVTAQVHGSRFTVHGSSRERLK
ncbi:MAG: hypothetical protein K8R28_00480, partial [Desulfobacterales bacterium]|nr:hypothetical protein [Desulfobacterales bacterium]